MNKNLPILLCLLFLAIACKQKTQTANETENVAKPTENLFSFIPASESGINFNNTVSNDDSVNILVFQYYYNGSGVAVGDINNDGLQDLFFSANQSPSKLYLNKGNFKFEDITEKSGIKTAGWCTGTVMADVNNDRHPDIFVCRSGIAPNADTRNLLYINNKNGTFTEKGLESGFDNASLSTGATFFDMDNDGDLDCYVLNYPNAYDYFLDNNLMDKTRANDKTTHRMYENLGDGKFKDITKSAGMFSFGYGLSATPGDINRDGYMDLYVGNDFMTPDFCYINNGNKTFTDKHAQYFKHTTLSTMGSDVADFNNDGLLDLVLLDMLPEDNYGRKMITGATDYDRYVYALRMGYGHQLMRNTLHLNNGSGYFSEIGGLAGISATDWSWSSLFADLDNDGMKDIFITNGIYKDLTNNDFMSYKRYEETMSKGAKFDKRKLLDHLPSKKIRNYIYKNNGDLTFKDVSNQWGMTEKKFAGTGASYVDLDNDGDLDLVSANINEVAYVYKNNSEAATGNHYLKLEFYGSESNSYGYGCKVNITTKSGKQYYEHTGMRGFQSSSDPNMCIGLGKDDIVSELIITWPSGKMQRLRDVKANQVLKIREGEATENAGKANETVGAKSFTDITKESGIAFRHAEDDFIDFKRDKLIPHKLSQLGPGIAVADVNGDGTDDFFIGNGAGSAGGALFLQNSNGSFSKAASQPWKSDNKADNLGCLFMDADGDADVDLYVVNGGTHYAGNNPAYNNVLYVNDGKGNFSKSTSLPADESSGSVVCGADFDRDGDIDLFVGGRILPAEYPKASRSFVLRNDKGKFTDATAEICPALQTPGMVSAALWTDLNGDGAIDLMVTGEFMKLMCFVNENGKLPDKTAEMGLDGSSGWWNSLTPGDFDGDGDMDYIAGNRGLNGIVKATPAQPVSVYAKDFDNNGSLDPILCYYVLGGSYPLAQMKDLWAQMPALQKKYKRYEQYATQTVNEVFKKEDLDAAYKLDAHYFASCYIENLGNKSFKITPLPNEAQISCVFGTQATDIDNDGNLDVLLVGNFFWPQVELGREDALNGLVLKGDGKGGFTPQKPNVNGFYAPNDAKALTLLINNGKALYLVSNNNDEMQAISSNSKCKTLKLNPNEYKIIITTTDGKKYTLENGYGSGYLSQNSRTALLPPNTKEATIINYKNEKRVVGF